MYKTVTILYLVCLFLYILFSRQPDYFEAEFSRGIVVKGQLLHKKVQYKVQDETYTVPIHGWGADQVAPGQQVNVIYDPTIPSNGSLYSFFAYWFTLPELLTSLIAYTALFITAILITGKTSDRPFVPGNGRRKYNN